MTAGVTWMSPLTNSERFSARAPGGAGKVIDSTGLIHGR